MVCNCMHFSKTSMVHKKHIQQQKGIPNEQKNYRQISNIRRTLVDNKIVHHSDVVGASPTGAAPTTSSFWT